MAAMKKPDPYTYRCGERIDLRRVDNEFVVRTDEATLAERGYRSVEQVSGASYRVAVAEEQKLDAEMDSVREFAPAHHAYKIGETDEDFLITDRVTVTFVQAPDEEVLRLFMAKYGLVLLHRYDGDREFLFKLTDATGMNPIKLVAALEEDDDTVARADNDLNFQARRSLPYSTPTDPKYQDQWHLHTRSSGSDLDDRSSTHCEQAWQGLDGFGSQEVVIGITDDGCRLDHSDFGSQDKFAGWGYFAGSRLVKQGDFDADPNEMYTAGENHGTSCAGVAAADTDATHTTGAAPGCRLLPIKWELLPNGYLAIADSKLRTVLDYVADKVDVLSSSWSSVPTALWSSSVVNRIRQLAVSGGPRGNGIVFLWAAGNDNSPILHEGDIDIPFTDGWRRRPDGSMVWEPPNTTRRFRNNLVGIPGLTHVAALASTARRSHYSNYGEGIGITAPTNNVHTYHRMYVPGRGVTTTTGSQTWVTEHFGGTSSATPLVAGITALVRSAAPSLNAQQVISILQRTASRDLDDTSYPATPPASYDQHPEQWEVSPIVAHAWENRPDGQWSPWFGYGNVDAAAAVREAMGPPAAPTHDIEGESQPDLAITDDDPVGVSDVIELHGVGLIRHIEVDVDITHNWKGDLRVLLVSPAGTEAVLHDRRGEYDDNIHATYTSDGSVGLASLLGEAVEGPWTLRAYDLEQWIEGTLDGWAIRAETGVGRISETEIVDRVIPDDSADGITSDIEIALEDPIEELSVGVQIDHPYRPDLEVTLTPPGGQAVTLMEWGDFNDSGLNRTFDMGTFAALSHLRGSNPRGTWRLRVADRWAQDEGRLLNWSLTVGS